MKILITGGCGYKGSKIIPSLIKDGHTIINIDSQWFGNYLEEHSSLINIKSDIRNIDQKFLQDIDIIIHLANIANDPAVDLNPTLSWETNVLAGQQLADKAARCGVKQFIFASSGSVYGISEEAEVREDIQLVPISTYNKTKMVAERIFLSYKDKMRIHCIRPATVCGLSPRMRLDVSVNLLTFQALKSGEITIFGGSQTRPNIHIDDMVNVYKHFINNDLPSGCYNAGFENISILDIAKIITKFVDAKITLTQSNDPRSYRQNSEKLLATGFKPKFSIETAIKEIILAYKNGNLIENEMWYTVKWMKKLNIK